MADVEFNVDDSKLRNLVNKGQGTFSLLAKVTDKVAANANAMSAGFRTGRYHRNHESPAVGGTQPEYGHDVRRFGRTTVGIVYTGNYSAMKDNHLHNTLMKSL